MGLTVDSSQLTFLPSSKSRDTKTRTNIKNMARTNLDIVLSLRIHDQLSAPIVNGGGDSYWKWKDFQLSSAPDLDLGSVHTAYHRALLIDLYLHAKFHWNRRIFCGRMDGHLRPALLRRHNAKNDQLTDRHNQTEFLNACIQSLKSLSSEIDYR